MEVLNVKMEGTLAIFVSKIPDKDYQQKWLTGESSWEEPDFTNGLCLLVVVKIMGW